MLLSRLAFPIRRTIGSFALYSTSTPPVSDQQIQIKVFEVLSSAAKCKQDKLSKAATFQQLGFDSLDGVELVIAMEQQFDVQFSDQQAYNIDNVDAAIKAISRHLKDQPGEQST